MYKISRRKYIFIVVLFCLFLHSYLLNVVGQQLQSGGQHCLQCFYIFAFTFRFFVSFWFLTTTPSDFPCIWPQTTCVSMKSFAISSWSLPARTMVMHPTNGTGICLPSSFHGKCSGVLVSMAFSALTWTNSVTEKQNQFLY